MSDLKRFLSREIAQEKSRESVDGHIFARVKFAF